MQIYFSHYTTISKTILKVTIEFLNKEYSVDNLCLGWFYGIYIELI